MATEEPAAALRAWLAAKVDASGVAVLRALFGAVMLWSTLRFVARRWIESLLLEPRFHFAYPGFAWITPSSPGLVYACFAAMALGALGIALGLFQRASALLFFVSFTGVELFDRAYYLNHYYLVSLFAGLCCVLPLSRAFSLDAWLARRRGAPIEPTVPRAVPLVLRAQLGLVYFYAGLAKLDGDWLLRGEPIATWMRAYADLPWIGPWLQAPAVAVALAWAGMLFDLGVPLALSWPRARAWAFAALVAFHAATGALLSIGVFPVLMIALAPVFFPHAWPRALLTHRAQASVAATGGQRPRPLAWAPTTGLALYLLVQALLPLRHVALPGAVNWSRAGFDFAWRVMLTESTGYVALRVVDRSSGAQFRVSPAAELTTLQTARMAVEPALIEQYAEHVADGFRARGHRRVAVYADAWASMNGRPAQRLLDPRVDLAARRSGFEHDAVVLPLRGDAPLAARD